MESRDHWTYREEKGGTPIANESGGDPDSRARLHEESFWCGVSYLEGLEPNLGIGGNHVGAKIKD